MVVIKITIYKYHRKNTGIVQKRGENMNHIEVQDIQTPYGYKESFWLIDKKSLPEYLNGWASESQDEYLKSIGSFFALCPAWSKDSIGKVILDLCGRLLGWIQQCYPCFCAKKI